MHENEVLNLLFFFRLKFIFFYEVNGKARKISKNTKFKGSSSK